MNDQSPVPTVSVPHSGNDAGLYLHRIGELSRQLDAIDATHETMVAALERSREDHRAPLIAEREALVAVLREWAGANRHALTEGGRTKRVIMSGGVIGWRKRPAKVVLGAKPDQIVLNIEAAGLNQFIRHKKVPDKTAMLKSPKAAASVPGVEVQPGREDFFVEPGAAK